MKEFFLVAKIFKLNDHDGSFKVSLITDFPDNFIKQKFFYVEFFGEMKKLFTEKIVLTKNGCVVKFKDFDSGEKAELLLGKEIFIDESQLSKLNEFQFFEHQLIGAEVLINENKIGFIKDIYKMPANDVLVIETIDDKELLIPFVRKILDSFDVDKKIMKLKTEDNFFDEVI